MRTLPLQEFYKALSIDERDVKKFRQLAANTIQIIFQDGYSVLFKIEKGTLIKYSHKIKKT